MNAIQEIKNIVAKEKPKDIMAFVRKSIAQEAITNLNTAIGNCDDCSLNCPTKSITFGNPNASVMVVSDSIIDKQIDINVKTVHPYQNTEEYETLVSVFKHFNVNMNEIFWMNAVNCKASKVENNKVNYYTPTTKQIEHCIEFVKYAIDIVHPAIILLIGNVALNIFKKSTMQKEHGQWITAFTIPAMPIYSPTYIKQLKGEIDEDSRKVLINEFVSDIGNAFSYIKNNYPNNNVVLDTSI